MALALKTSLALLIRALLSDGFTLDKLANRADLRSIVVIPFFCLCGNRRMYHIQADVCSAEAATLSSYPRLTDMEDTMYFPMLPVFRLFHIMLASPQK
jgi:hypothetical protein